MILAGNRAQNVYTEKSVKIMSRLPKDAETRQSGIREPRKHKAKLPMRAVKPRPSGRGGCQRLFSSFDKLRTTPGTN